MSNEDVTRPLDESLKIPLHEEILEPYIREAETGRIRIHKRVETVPVEGTVDTTRDDVNVERVQIGKIVDEVPQPRQEGDTYVIPVIEEVLVTEKRLMLREELRVTRRQITDQVPVSGTIRREVVEFEELDTINALEKPAHEDARDRGAQDISST